MKLHFFKSELAKRDTGNRTIFYTDGNLSPANFTTAKWTEQSYYSGKQKKKGTAENGLS